MPGPPERARSSAGEHSLHTGGVTGSIPVAPTIVSPQILLLNPARPRDQSEGAAPSSDAALSMNVEQALAGVDGVRQLQIARCSHLVACRLEYRRSLRV